MAANTQKIFSRLLLVFLLSLMFLAGARAADDDLLYAAERGDMARVAEELENGADINVSNGIGDALYYATRSENLRMVAFLLERGIDHQGAFAAKSLHHAIQKGYDDITVMLLSYGVNADAVSSFGGVTPLMTAARHGRKRVVTELLTRGAQVNLQSDHGNTALQQAIIWGNEDIAEELRARKAEDSFRPYHDPETQEGMFMSSLLENALDSPEKRRLYYEEPGEWFAHGRTICSELAEGLSWEFIEYRKRRSFGDIIGTAMVEASAAILCPELRPMEAQKSSARGYLAPVQR